MGEIRKLNSIERDQSEDKSNDRSSLSHAKSAKLIDIFRKTSQKSQKQERDRLRASPHRGTVVNQDYLHEPLLSSQGFEPSSPVKQVRYSEALPDDKYKITREESSDDEESNLSPLKNSLASFSIKR